ncbi:hypothetical protein BJ508DRAFT_412889 [Ascobolus immersus RN42]|uniref:Uncharacterized protein n=1 Tax=Ascobolus immersus RN42 TaxID=1160509 RepID=A0A3N4IJ27_ASCIM|nr:hypothetical protein BJ508DRAFT_412889 [Ascobolus immersus RN42]
MDQPEQETPIPPEDIKPKVSQKLRSILRKSKQKVKRAVMKLKPSSPRKYSLRKLRKRKIPVYIARLRPETLDSPFANLPVELHLEIGSWLENKDNLSVARTCHRLSAIYAGKAVCLRMAWDLLEMDKTEAPEDDDTDKEPAKFDSFRKNVFQPDNKLQLCRLSNFLFRQCQTGASTRLFLVLLLQHLVGGPLLKEYLPTVKRISHTLQARINDHPKECSEIQGFLLRYEKLTILTHLTTNGFLLTSSSSKAMNGQKPLHYCARHNKLEAVIYLLRHGFEPSESDDGDIKSPIFNALGLYPAPLDIPAKHEGLAFYIDKKIKIAKLLIAAGGDPHCTDAPESPILRLFSRYEDAAKTFEYLSFLIPAIIRTGPPGGRYPTCWAPGSSSYTCGSNSTPRPQMYTSSYTAADTEYIDTEINLPVIPLYAGKTINNPLDFLVSPPHLDRLFDYVQRISLLSTFLMAGLSPNTRNESALTPIQVAVFRLGHSSFKDGREGYPDGFKDEKRFLLAAVKLLIKYGAFIEERISKFGGYNVVEAAAALDEVEFCEALVGVEEARIWCEIDMPWVGAGGGWFQEKCEKGTTREDAGKEIRELVQKAKGFRTWE